MSDLRDWADQAACKGEDPEIFFPERGADVATAKSFCARCPVVDRCLQWAIEHEQQGIWGNTSSRQRRNIRKRAGIRVVTPASLADVNHVDPQPSELEDGIRSAHDIAVALDVSQRTVIRHRTKRREEKVS